MKKFLISVFTLIFIISMVTVVNAASGSISATASSSKVTRGNTFTVTISGTADENITGMQAGLTYDKTKLSLEGKSAETGFSDLSGDNEIAISASGSTDIKSGNLYTLTFKVLDTAELGKTTVSITGVTLALVDSNQTQENVVATDGSATITIVDGTSTENKKDSTNSGNGTGNTGTKTPSTTGSTKSGSGSASSKSASTSDDEENEKKLPQTGVEVVSVVAIAGLSACAIVSYVSYKKYKNI